MNHAVILFFMVLGISIQSSMVDILPFLYYRNSNFSTSSPAFVIFYFPSFSMMATLTGMTLYLTVVLI